MSINVNVGNFIPTNVVEVGNEISVNQLAAITAADSPSALNPFSTASHIHTIANVSGLQTALDGKAGISHTHTISSITDLQTALDGKASNAHTHTIGNITGLPEALSLKADVTHTHTIANITGLQTALDGKASTTHLHGIADITGLQTALDGKASTASLNGKLDLAGGTMTGGLVFALNDTDARITFNDGSIQSTASYSKAQSDANMTTVGIWLSTKSDVGHTHTIANVTGLQTALDGKANTSHTHTISQIQNLESLLISKTDKTAQTTISYNQTSYVYDNHNGYLYLLYYNGAMGQVYFSDSLLAGSRIQFIQDQSALQPITFSGNVFNREDKLTTLGPRSQVTAVKTSAGWQIFGDLQFPPNGTLLSSACTEWTGSDALGIQWTGYYMFTQTYANGTGGTYQTSSLGGGSCYLPYGYCIQTGVSTYENTISWSGCSSSGTVVNSSSTGNLYADGSGSTYTQTTGGWSAQYGDIIYDAMNGCIVKHDGMGGYFVEDNSSSGGGYPSYGSYIGQNSGTLYVYYSPTSEYFEAGSFTEDLYADGYGGVGYTANRVDSWWSYGTQIGYDNSNYIYVYSDGNGSYYT